MAPKRPSAPENPPSVTPSSEEEESEELTDSDQQNPVQNQSRNPNSVDSDEEEDSESSDEESEKDAEQIKPPSGQKLAPPPSDSDDEDSESDTESSDTIPSPTVSGFTIKPTDDSAKQKKPAQNPKNQGSKSAQKANENDTQMKGKPANGVGLEEKRSPIVRLWGDDDELAIVRGMVEYRTKKGRDPCADRDAFHEFMKKSLRVEVTKNQLMDKIRRLKKKYENNAKKGENPVISKPHELKLFELSKKVWGGDGAGAVESSVKAGKRKADKSVKVGDLVKKESNGETSNKKAKKSVDLTKSLDIKKGNGKYVVEEGSGLDVGLKGDQAGFWDSYPLFKEALEVENSGYFSRGWKGAMEVQFYGKIGAAKATEMEEKWKRFQVKEAELKLFKLELVAEQTKLVIDALRNAKS